MTPSVLDEVSAWGELARFAEVAGIELDERAHPDYKPSDDDEAADDESEVSDYRELIRALRAGHLSVEDNGALVLRWKKPPHKDRPTLTLDPEGGDGWAYGQATRALHTVPAPIAVSKAARRRMPSAQEEDRLGRMDRFLEILGDEAPGTMIRLCNRLDRDLVTDLTKFILLE